MFNRGKPGLLLILALTTARLGGEAVDLEMVTRIKQEGLENSHIDETMIYLTDYYGPRLTGTPALREAKEWAVKRLEEWGLERPRLEEWGEFGRGWTLERLSIHMLAPRYSPLIAYPMAWTSGTRGKVRGRPVLVEIESEADFEKYRGGLRGAIVLNGPAPAVEPPGRSDTRRWDEDDLRRLAAAPLPSVAGRDPVRRVEARDRRELHQKTLEFFREEGVAVILEPGRGRHGTLVVTAGGAFRGDSQPEFPAVVVAAEHYGRMARLLQRGLPVEVEVDVGVRFYDEDPRAYNVVAEIAGTDERLRDELVLFGAHVDSWHAATGATDNAAGTAVVMEAMRILRAVGARPRRTVRLALWTGEEQGLLGSRAYVRVHFADRETMEIQPAHSRVSAYFNLDNGSGKIRGIYLQGNDAARPIFEALFKPFDDMGVNTVSIRGTGGTDHIAFDEVGIPGFQFLQDPLSYRTRTHHSNMDFYDHVSVGDLMQAAVVLAATVYHTSMREEAIPRKPLPVPRER